MSARRRQRGLVLPPGRGVGHAREGLVHEDVADAAVLVEAGPHVVGLAGCELVRQVGVGEQLAAHRHEVGPAVGQDQLRFVGLEASERDDRDARGLPHRRGVPREVTHTVRRVRVGGTGGHVHRGVRGDVHRVEPGRDRSLDHLELVLEALAVGLVVLQRVDAHPQREVAEPRPGRPDDLEEQAGAPVDVAAPRVGAVVDGR